MEILNLNLDMHNKLLITINSTACITPKIVFDEEPKLIYLSNLLPRKNIKYNKAKGLYAPLTESSTMIVDGYVVSCLANTYSHTLGKYLVKIGYHLGLLCNEEDNCVDKLYFLLSN
jgi:hypothetical protein